MIKERQGAKVEMLWLKIAELRRHKIISKVTYGKLSEAYCNDDKPQSFIIMAEGMIRKSLTEMPRETKKILDKVLI